MQNEFVTGGYDIKPIYNLENERNKKEILGHFCQYVAPCFKSNQFGEIGHNFVL